jgi:alpha-L-rhamnosidase
MKPAHYLLPVFLCVLSWSCKEDIPADLKAGNLKCEYLNEAVLAKPDPRFSWELTSQADGQLQSAWQVIVSDDPVKTGEGKGNIWNSGKVKGNETFNIKWKKNKLRSFSKYYWKVKVWDKDGKASDWSETAVFITGAYNKADWKASWIGVQPERPLEYPLLYKHIGYLSSYSDNFLEEKWVQTDLGKISDFDKIILYPAFNNMLNIREYYFPLSFRIECSSDGETWNVLAHKESVNTGKPAEVDISPVQSRFVRIVATKLQEYKTRIYDYEDLGDTSKSFAFALAELQVLNKK